MHFSDHGSSGGSRLLQWGTVQRGPSGPSGSLGIGSGVEAMKEINGDGFELEISIEELEAKVAPDDNGETVLPLPKRGGRR